MARYVLRDDQGKIRGSDRWPNAESGVPVDEQSQEWLDFINLPAPTADELFDQEVNGSPVLTKILDQLEAELPGFRDKVRARP